MKTTSFVPALALLALAACGDDGAGPRTRLLPSEPVQMSAAVRGLTAYYTPSLTSALVKFGDDQDEAANVVLLEQVYSEFAHARVGGQPRAPEPRFDFRMQEIYSEDGLATELVAAGEVYWVIDLQRLDREWLVDWNGLERDEPETRESSLTFSIRRDANDGDYQAAVIERVMAAFEDANPRPANVIIGAEMERHYAVAPADWPAFAEFVGDLADALRAYDPAVRVGVGINWSNFVEEIVPRFVEEAGQGTVNFQVVRAAWEAVLDPLYLHYPDPTRSLFETALDFYAFAAIPDTDRFLTPADLPDDHFAAIPTFFAEYPTKQLPVAWFAVGWPSDQSSTGSFGDWWDFFVARAGGYPIELVSWWGFGNLIESPDCTTMTGTLGLGRSTCYRGLYSSSGSPISGLRDAYFENAN